MPEKIPTWGTKFYRTSIALANEVKGLAIVNPFTQEKAVIEATVHDDTSRGKIPGIRDTQPLTCRLIYDPQDTMHAQLKADFDAAPTATVQTYIITCPSKADGSKKASWSYLGFISRWEEGEKSVDGVYAVDFDITITGQPAYDADDTTVPA